LEGIVLDERALQRMQIITISQARSRGDLGTVVCDGEDQATVHASAIQQHRASTALAVVTALLRARHPQPLAQSIEERRSRIDLELPLGAVDPERHRGQALLADAGNQLDCGIGRTVIVGTVCHHRLRSLDKPGFLELDNR
jgi:hypothetical protein